MKTIRELLYQIEDQMQYEHDLDVCTEQINKYCDDMMEILENVDRSVAKQLTPLLENILDSNNSIYRVYESQVCCRDAKQFLDDLLLICEEYLTDNQLLDIKMYYGIDLLGEY